MWWFYLHNSFINYNITVAACQLFCAYVNNKYKNYTVLDIGASYVWAKNHTFAVALNNVTDVGLDWVPNTSHKGYANAYRDYLDGRNLWLSYTYSF